MRVLEMRAIDGPNLYGRFPVVVMRLDLGRWDEVRSSDLPGFNERLCDALPGLAEHHCGLGRPGGLLERLREGTLLGHVVEHVALELQALAGSDVYFGRTRQAAGPVYTVVFEQECAEVGLAAGRRAVRLVRDLLAGRSVAPADDAAALRALLGRFGLGPTTRAIAAAARARGIPVVRLAAEGSWLQLGYGRYQRRVRGSLTARTAALGVDAAADKALTKRLLAAGGVPVPPGEVVAGAAAAVAAFRRLGPPVAVKPVDANHGRGVSLRLETAEAVRHAFRLARVHSEAVIVERYIAGRQYRVLVVGGRVVAAAERLPAQVTGDGRSTIAELVRRANADPLRGRGHERPLTRIRLDRVSLAVLARAGHAPHSVPRAGETVYLRDGANLSTGGTAHDVSDRVHPAYAEACRRAAALVGLDVAGVDLVAADIAAPPAPGSWAVIEVNASPGLRMHLHPSAGARRDVAGAVVDWLFPPGVPHSIPVVAVTGTNGKTTTARLIAAALAAAGLRVGLTSTDGVWVGGQRLRAGDCAGPESARAVLADPEVDAAVLETARGGILRAGLAFERCDVAVVTGIAPDHLGQGGLQTVADLADVKSLVVEAVGRDGHAVLNAADPLVAAMAARCRGRVAFFALSPRQPLLRRHVASGGPAAYVRDGWLCYAVGGREQPLARVAEVPIALGGAATYNLLNALAGALAALCAGMPVPVVAETLRRFGRDVPNPGRWESRQAGGVRVILDYGHNARGMAAALVAARRQRPQRLIGVLGVPGDRRDDLIVAAGRVAALCDAVVLREDADRRGRAAGAVAALLRAGAAAARVPPERIDVVLDEGEAVLRALGRAAPGDLVVVFYERLAVVEAALARWAAALPAVAAASGAGS